MFLPWLQSHATGSVTRIMDLPAMVALDLTDHLALLVLNLSDMEDPDLSDMVALDLTDHLALLVLDLTDHLALVVLNLSDMEALGITVGPMNHHLGKYPDAGVIQDLPWEILNTTVVPLDHPAMVDPDLSDMGALGLLDMVAPDLFDTLAFNEIKHFWGFSFANDCTKHLLNICRELIF